MSHIIHKVEAEEAFKDYPPAPLSGLSEELRNPALLLEYARAMLRYSYGELAAKSGTKRLSYRGLIRRLLAGRAVSLQAIQRFASAMDCEAVVVLLPRDPQLNSVRDLRKHRGFPSWSVRAMKRPRVRRKKKVNQPPKAS